MTSFELDVTGPAEMQRTPASDRKVTSYPGDESLRRSYPGAEGDSNKKLQIGAGERRAVPTGHGFKTTATIETSPSATTSATTPTARGGS